MCSYRKSFPLGGGRLFFAQIFLILAVLVEGTLSIRAFGKRL